MVSVLCLVAVLLTQLLPMLMLGMIGFGGGDPFFDGAAGGFSGSVYDGSVAVESNGAVDGATLASAVTAAAHGELFGAVACDPVAKAVVDVSIVCRRSEPGDIRSYAVVRFTNDTGRFQAMTFIYG